MSDDMLLQVRGLNAWYGAAQVLFGVELKVARGEVVGLVGANGAGKSTLLKAVMGLQARRTGQIAFAGQDISDWPAHQVARLGMAYVPQDRRIFTELTVLENMEVARQAPRFWPDGSPVPVWTPERLFKVFPNLAEMTGRLGSQMSGGEQQMLAVARSLMGNPCLVLLDEPSEGMAPLVVQQMAQMIRTLRDHGVSLLLAEQNLEFLRSVSDRVYPMAQGTLPAVGMAE